METRTRGSLLRSPGLQLLAIGAGHQAVTAWLAADALIAVVQDGVLDAVGRDPERMAALWSLAFGFALMLCGLAVRTLERAGAPAPRALGAGLVALVAFGGALMPASGFWLAIGPAWALLGLRRRSAAAPGG